MVFQPSKQWGAEGAQIGLPITASFLEPSYLPYTDESEAPLAGLYGGIDLRYIYRLNAIFEIGGGVLVGPGVVDSDYLQPETFAVIEPGVGFVYRPTRFFAVTFGTSYRAVPSSPTLNPPAGELSAFTGALGLQFGWL